MKHMHVGYARVSSHNQNLDMQLDALTRADCIQIFEEKVTGSRRDRPELENMMKMLRAGDTVVVYKLDRLGRSMKHLIEIVNQLHEMDVNFISLQENIDTSTAAGRFFFHTMAALAEFEREMIKERSKSGLEAARQRGRVGGRPKADAKAVEKALKLYDAKTHSLKEITDICGISKHTLYRNLKNRSQASGKDV